MKKYILTIFGIILAASSHAQSASNLESQLIGPWAQFAAPGLIEGVTVFSANHALAMYPKCGKEADALRSAGFSVISGTWHIVGESTLRIGLEHNGKSATLDSSVAITGSEMRLTSTRGQISTMTRYFGPLPPKCPFAQ